MKTDPLAAFDQYADAVESQMVRMTEELRTVREELRTQREEVRSLRAELLETRNAQVTVVGPPGPTGPAGEKGDAGERGGDGHPGRDGAAVVGPVGPQGERGVDGAPSVIPGPQGECGADGAQSTVPGPQGERGSDGAPSTVPGPQGERGTDGIATLEELDARIEARFSDVQVRNMADWHRDVYRVDAEYQRGNLVTYDGGQWLALTDSKAQQPGTSAAWKLIVKKGRDGRDKT